MRLIPIRKLQLDWSALPLDQRGRWFAGDPFFTHLVNAMSLTFPLGERFFVDSVKRYKGEPALAGMEAEIAAFIGQEAHHGQAHESFNAWMLDGHPDRAALEGLVRDTLGTVRAELSPLEQLAVTCALEHFTAVMAELLLEDETLRTAMQSEVLRLLSWHAIEETEHKAVAFDVYRALGGTYVMRARIMLLTTLSFIGTLVSLQRTLLGGRHESRLGVLRALGSATPWLTRIARGYLAYFRPSFHPWDRDPAAALDRARAELALDKAAAPIDAPPVRQRVSA